jgi:hypothetical protein
MGARPVKLAFLAFVMRLAVVLTPAQRVLALVAFDGVQPRDLRGEDRQLARRLFGDVQTVRRDVAGVLCVVAGARSGKSFLGALRLLHLALTADLFHLAHGEVAVGIIVAPDLRLARQTLRFLIGQVRASPVLSSMVVGETADSIGIRRPDGRVVSIECLPATRGGSALRGRWLVGVVDEETAYQRDADYVINDQAIFDAVTTRIVPGGQIMVISTPWAKVGLLWQLHYDNHGHPRTALAAHAPTSLMRDGDPVTMAIVERERRRDPIKAAREYDALFLDGASMLFASADVDAAVDVGVVERPYDPACSYRMTVDVGLRNDSTVVLIFHVELQRRDGGPPVRHLVVDAVRILKPTIEHRISLDEVEATIARYAHRFHVSIVVGDIHYSDALAPRLAARGIRFSEAPMHPNAQQARATLLAARFSAGAIRLVHEPTLIKELKEATITRHAGGRTSVGAPDSKRKHDDTLDALLLAEGVSIEMPAQGGNIRCETSVNVMPGGVDVQTRWSERVVKNGQTFFVPAGPPVGTPEWRELRRQQRAMGIFVPGEPDLDSEGPNIPIIN